MNHTCECGIEFPSTPTTADKLAVFDFRKRLQDALVKVLVPNFEAAHLSEHLRKDAGMDEVEFERERIAKAPLIR